jgi:hypothetical protein
VSDHKNYYDAIKPLVLDLQLSELTVSGAAINSGPRRRRKEAWNVWRRQNERRLRQELYAKAEREHIKPQAVSGPFSWLLGLAAAWALQQAKAALWEAVKQHVRELLDRLQAELFPDESRWRPEG